MCTDLLRLAYQRRLVNVSIRTGETRDYAALAKKENLQPIELELRLAAHSRTMHSLQDFTRTQCADTLTHLTHLHRKMEDQVNTLKSEFTYMKNREAMHRNTNGKPSAHSSSHRSRVALSFILCNNFVTLNTSRFFLLRALSTRIHQLSCCLDDFPFCWHLAWSWCCSSVLFAKILQVKETYLSNTNTS